MIIILKKDRTLNPSGTHRIDFKAGDSVDMPDSIALKMIERGDAIKPWIKKSESELKPVVEDKEDKIKIEKEKVYDFMKNSQEVKQSSQEKEKSVEKKSDLKTPIKKRSRGRPRKKK